MNNYSFFIPVVNRFDLLDRAVESSKDLWEELTIIDNSPDGLDRKYPSPITVFRPCVPLSCPQTFNFMMRETKAMGRKICIWQHNDAEAGDGTPLKLLELARQCVAEGKMWSAIFSNYDAMSALNADSIDIVGEWDIFFQQYYCDNDWYRRARLAGFETVESHLPVTHEPSQTLKSDPRRQLLNSVTFPLFGFYYQQKWGGSPGQETYRTPFNQ